MEASNGIIGSGILGFLSLLPGLLVTILGLLLSFVAMKRMPKAALVGIIAYGLMLLLHLAAPLVNVFLMAALARNLPISGPGLSFVFIQGLVNLVMAFLGAAASGVLIYGYFFADRKKTEDGVP